MAKQKLIDANALAKLFKSYGTLRGDRLCGDMSLEDVVSLIENAPVVESVVWHPITEKPPKEFENYLVTRLDAQGNEYVTVGNFPGKLFDKYTTHWAELPKPQKEEK